MGWCKGKSCFVGLFQGIYFRPAPEERLKERNPESVIIRKGIGHRSDNSPADNFQA